MTSIAYLGTGLLGSAFVEAALERGDQVTVWNRTASKMEPLVARGATAAASPAAAVAQAERVHLGLVDDATVEAVLAMCQAALRPEAIVIDHTTTRPDLTAARMARLADQGVAYLHCPVFMGPAAARTATGSMMVSGDPAVYARVETALAAQTGRVSYLGPEGDRAATVKLCGNAYNIGIVALIADVLAVARGGGVSPSEILPWLEQVDARAIVKGRGARMVAGDFDASFELTMARKDVRLMLETAADQPIAMLAGLMERMDQVIAAGDGDRDMAVIARAAVEPS